MPSTNKQQLRLRVFAGPNGSGKSTIIQSVKNYTVKNRAIDFGAYINADDIAAQLRSAVCRLDDFDIITTNKEFAKTAIASGLISDDFPEAVFEKAYSFHDNAITLNDKETAERLAQIIADFLRKKMLQQQQRFSFETVFSHHSKVNIMREAKEMGYKVYLYFVATESPEINKFRVLSRKAQGGHDVDPDKIESRYYRSLELLYDTCQFAYQVFFFDNS